MIGLVTPPQHIDSNDDPNSPSVIAHHKYVGVVAEFTARAEVMLQTSPTVATSLGILNRQRVTLRQCAYDTYDVEITYGRQKTAVGEWYFDFDTTGGTAHITAPKEHIARYGLIPVGLPGAGLTLREPGPTSGHFVPKHAGAIGVDKDDVKGVDIAVPALKFNITFKHIAGFVSIAYMKLLHDITAAVNLTDFMGFDPGEIMFLGARGSDGSEAEASVVYSFAGSPNQTETFYVGEVAITSGVGTALSVYDAPYNTEDYVYPGKRGWDVIWVKYKDNENVANPVKEAQEVYIDRVYDYVDLGSVLGFGG